MNDLKFTTASDYMNTGTKFDDLMYRAGLTAQGCWDEMDDYDRKAIEKFAELIVRDCIKESMDEIVADEEIAQEKDPLIREYLNGNNQGIVDAVVRFRNYFGVEE